MKKELYFVIILLAGLLSACKKDNKPNTNIAPSKTGSVLNLIQDSVYLYAAEDYLWNTSLPSYSTFNPRASFKAADDLTALTNEVNALSQFAINPATNAPYEYYTPHPGQAKYSFIDDGTVTAELNGTNGDFGFAPIYNKVTDLRVKYVYPGSPADLAGIKRGYQITSINGNTNLSYDAPGYGTGTSNNLNYVINAYTNSNAISMTLQKPDGTPVSVNLTIANYTVNPVLKYTTFDEGNGHIVGYMVFNSFTSAANANPLLNAAISYFAAQGVTDLAVDLRYNGGGYVNTAQYLDNLIVPAAKNGTLMYSTHYNSNLASGKDPLLGNQWRTNPPNPDFNYGQIDYSVGTAINSPVFAKVGTLNVNRVFFIITGSTASASELTINNLRPVMDVQFVGETSYGKPVGFFDIAINKYEMFIPEFSVQNSVGQGGYYSGFTPGTSAYPGIVDHDDPTKDFGDPTEGLLAHVLSFVKTGTYAVKTPVIQSLQTDANTFSLQESRTMTNLMNERKFMGMVYNNTYKGKKKN